ncbi:class I adenylate-forming enzyme family protein [Burkholderia ubonensis]|uniref:class I adenylate-forming enzyme family protein n=1 Tax=Burkholderia ubonensis TaxID=101571 RepID=UPI0007C7797B|nr:AMP-binding protein [Burkholderia ubonensis]
MAVRTLVDLVAQARQEYADLPALVVGGETWNYRRLTDALIRLADQLRGAGLKRGDRVVVCNGNSLPTVATFLAAQLCGACACLLPIDTPDDTISYVIGNSGARLFIGAADLIERLRRVSSDAPAPSADAGALRFIDAAHVKDWCETAAAGLPMPTGAALSVDRAMIVYTSGSTGKPKGVVHTHQSVTAALGSLLAYLPYRRGDVVMCALPMSFDYGLYQLLMSFSVGACVVLEREGELPTAILRDLARYRCTVFPGIATLYVLLAGYARAGRFDFSALRFVTNTGMALRATHVSAIRTLFPQAEIYSMYGLTECKRCTYLPPQELARKPDSVGIAIPDTELMVVDADDAPCAVGEIGELVIRGATVMQGYWGDPVATARRIRTHPVHGDRCLYTGDHGWLDADGYFYFAGRGDDVVKVRGKKVVLNQVEKTLYECGGVREAVVLMVSQAGEEDVLTAFWSGDGEATRDGLFAHCLARLERHEVPEAFVRLDNLPKTGNGKIDRTALKKRACVNGPV